MGNSMGESVRYVMIPPESEARQTDQLQLTTRKDKEKEKDIQMHR